MPNTLQILHDIKQKIKSNLLWILLISILAGLAVALTIKQDKGLYKAYSKIFPLSINKAGSSSPVDAIKSQFGISDKTDYEKIYNVKELVTSKAISHGIVRSKPTETKYKNLASWVIADYNSALPFWKKPIKVDTKDSNNIFYVGADLFLAFTEIKSDEKTGFITITTSAHDQKLSQELNERILAELSKFYIKFVTEKPRTDLEKIKIMRDSLKEDLFAIERAIAGFIDANQLSVKTTTQLPQYKLIRAQKEIEQLYTTASTSYQNAKFKLLSESPIFQILDKPGPPYGFSKPSWKKFGAIAFILCFFLTSLLFCRKIFFKLIIEELSKN